MDLFFPTMFSKSINLRTFLFFEIYLFSFYVYECLPACMYMYHVCAWVPLRSEEGIGFSGTEVIGGCETPCGH